MVFLVTALGMLLAKYVLTNQKFHPQHYLIAIKYGYEEGRSKLTHE